MARSRVAALGIVAALTATAAEAQSFTFTGLFTGHIGVAAGKDVRDPSVVPGISLAVIDSDGYGAEIDIAHTNDFDDRFGGDSSITSGMLSFTYVYPALVLRPYLVAGAGVIGVRIAPDELPTVSRTEPGWTAGGGAVYLVDEMLGVRGDVRYFRHFNHHADLPLTGNGVLDFWRASIGVTLAWPIH